MRFFLLMCMECLSLTALITLVRLPAQPQFRRNLLDVRTQAIHIGGSGINLFRATAFPTFPTSATYPSTQTFGSISTSQFPAPSKLLPPESRPVCSPFLKRWTSKFLTGPLGWRPKQRFRRTSYVRARSQSYDYR